MVNVQSEEAEDRRMSCGWSGKSPEAQAPEHSVVDTDVNKPLPPSNVYELRPIVHPYIINPGAPLSISRGGPRTASKVLTLSLNPAITNNEADQPCRLYSAEGLLAKLNALTGYDILLEEPNLESGLALLISRNHDFGIAYSWFRSAFSFIELPPKNLQDLERNFVLHYSGLPNLSDYDGTLNKTKTENKDAYYQEPVIQATGSEETLAPPVGSAARRLWDLIANRVIPSEWHLRWSRGLDYFHSQSISQSVPQPLVKRLRDCLALDFAAISHSWVADLEMQVSPVNGMLWPLPLPPCVTIQAIRNELLSLRGRKSNHLSLIPPRYHYEYYWLDILCLRQSWYDKNGKLVVPIANAPENHVQLDHQRLQEWKTDVPTIGGIYREAQQVYVYLNGIGRRYIDDEAVWSQPTHWTKRVWTMQEWVESPSGYQPLILGTANKGINVGLRNIQSKLMLRGAFPNRGRMIADISSLKEFLTHLGQRSCSNEVDRVGGLLHFFSRKALPVFPVYKADETLEQAWTRLIGALSNSWKLALSATPWKEFTNYIPLLPSWQALQHTFTGTDIAGLGEKISMKNSPNIQRPLLGPMAIPCTMSQISHNLEEGCWLKSAEMRVSIYKNSPPMQVEVTFDPVHSSTYYLVPSLCLGTVVAPQHPMDHVRIENGDPLTPFNKITKVRMLRILGMRAFYPDILVQLQSCLREWEDIWYRNCSVLNEHWRKEFTIDCWNLLPPRIKLTSQNGDDLEEINPLSYEQLLELRLRLAHSPWACYDIFRVVEANGRGSEKITNSDCKKFRMFVSRLYSHIKNLDISSASKCLAGLDKSNYREFQRFLEILVYLLRGYEFDTQEAGDLEDDEISKFRANILVHYESQRSVFGREDLETLLSLDEGEVRDLHHQFLNVRRGLHGWLDGDFRDVRFVNYLLGELREEDLNSFANLFRRLVIDKAMEPYISTYVLNQELALVVCEKRMFGADPPGEWDGVSYRKVGIARMPVLKDHNNLGLPELERYWMNTYCRTNSNELWSWREVFEDLNTLDAVMMMQKYSAKSLYSVIYEDRGSNDGPAAMLASLKDIEQITGTLKWRHDREEWKQERKREEREREERVREEWEREVERELEWEREELEQEELRREREEWEREEREQEEWLWEREEREREREQSNRA